MSDAHEILGNVAAALAAETHESGRKTLEVLRIRSPELIELTEQTGEDLVATSASFIEVLLASLRQQAEPPWVEYDLTPKGRELGEALQRIESWGRTYMADPQAEA